MRRLGGLPSWTWVSAGSFWSISWLFQDVCCPPTDNGQRLVHIEPSRVKDHYILYCEGELHGKQIRMAKLVGEGHTSQRQSPPEGQALPGKGMPLWWGRGPAAAPPPGRCPGVFLPGLPHGLPLDVPGCLALPSHRLSSQPRDLQSSPHAGPRLGWRHPPVLPLILVSPGFPDRKGPREQPGGPGEFSGVRKSQETQAGDLGTRTER